MVGSAARPCIALATAAWLLGVQPSPAHAADILVTSATPASAEQGSLSLPVTIKGSNFPRSVTVKFCVSALSSATTCTEDKVTVLSARVRGSGTIDTVIDVAADASATQFDVWVIETQSGRKGRGTSLFSVSKKPGEVIEDAMPIQSISTDPTGNAVTLSWTVPSGVKKYDIRYSTAPLLSTTDLHASTTRVAPRSVEYNANPAGFTDYFTVRELAPDTTYYFAVNTLNSIGTPSVAYAFAEATTGSTGWRVDGIYSHADKMYCCQWINTVFDTAGQPGISWVMRDDVSATLPTRVVLARPDATGNFVQESIDASDYRQVSFFRHAYAPDTGLPVAVISGEPVSSGGKGSTSALVAHRFLFRRADGSWGREALHSTDSTFYGEDPTPPVFADTGDPALKATVAYAVRTRRNNTSTYHLAVRTRTGEGSWSSETPLDCQATGAILKDPDISVDTLGRLHFAAKASAQGQVRNSWIVGGVRHAGSWTFYRSGSYDDLPFNHLRVRPDPLGSPVIAAGLDDEYASTEYLIDLALLQRQHLEWDISPTTACTLPGFPASYERIDTHLPNTLVGSFTDGPAIDTQSWMNVTDLRVDDDGSIHVLAAREEGNHLVRELRVLSRCAGESFWRRDAIDRPNGGVGLDMYAPFSYGQLGPNGAATAYITGLIARYVEYGPSFDPAPGQTLYLARRAGSQCTPAPD